MADQEAEAKPKASIMNIHYACLEYIFEYLDLKDLLNIAHTCKRLQIAAVANFGDEHGKKCIILRFPINNELDKFFVGLNDILIVGPKLQLPFLRCFGAKILHLDLDRQYQQYPRPILTKINDYINQYCTDTLNGLTIHRNHLIQFEKPFKKLEKLVIEGGVLGAEFPNFANLYPSLRRLEMQKVLFEGDFIAVSLPHLVHLSIDITERSSSREILNANRQLQSLDFSAHSVEKNKISLSRIINMIRAHRSITKIKITLDFDWITKVSAEELLQLANEHPSMSELSLKQYQFTAENVVVCVGQLNSLKKFEFCVENEIECSSIREQLNGKWQFKHQRVERRFGRLRRRDPVYVIVLNRNE